MCGEKSPSGVRDARPSRRPNRAKPGAISASDQTESSPAAFRLSAQNKKPNQSTGFDLERSRSGMSLLSRCARKQGIWSLWRRAIAPYFSFHWKYGATLRSSVPSLKPLFLRFWVMRWVFAGLVRFRNRSFDLLRRDGPCRLPDGFVHWTHLLAWISMTFYLIKAAERRTRFALDLRSFSNFICSTER